MRKVGHPKYMKYNMGLGKISGFMDHPLYFEFFDFFDVYYYLVPMSRGRPSHSKAVKFDLFREIVYYLIIYYIILII